MSTAGALLQNKYDVQPSVQQERFVLRNHIAQSYKGAVFVVEDVWVPCSLCRAPVDPVVRIPVGKAWFHPQCLRCAVCSKPSRTDVFHAVRGQPVCVDCISRGFDHQVSHHASPGKRSSTGISSRAASRQSSVSRERSPAISGSTTPRRAISPSTDPSSRLPRLSATPFLDSRSVTRRQQELIEKQRLLSEGDQNIVLLLPPSPPVRTMLPDDASTKRRTPMDTGSVRRVERDHAPTSTSH